MAEITINKIRDAFKIFEEKLKSASASLDQRDQVGFEILSSITDYNLKHPRGILGLLFNGDNFSRDEKNKSNVVTLKNNLMVGVVSIIRFFDVPGADIDKFPMLPFEYPELAVDTMTGIEVFNTFNYPEYERKIVPVRTELVDEEKGVWKYLTTFSVPRDFVEMSFRT